MRAASLFDSTNFFHSVFRVVILLQHRVSIDKCVHVETVVGQSEGGAVIDTVEETKWVVGQAEKAGWLQGKEKKLAIVGESEQGASDATTVSSIFTTQIVDIFLVSRELIVSFYS